MRRKTPIGALFEGLVAGAIGAGLQTLFFRLTAPIAPKPPKEAFTPPEPVQAEEAPSETVVRRFVEGMAKRGPLDEQSKKRLGTILHFRFGAGWGALFGLWRASFPRLWSPAGVAGFSLVVWMVSNNIVMPAFKLAGWPHRYPLRSHAYAIAAHLVYGLGVAGALEAIDHADALPLLGGLAVARGRALGKAVDRRLRRGQALVPRQMFEAPRHFASALARRARDLRH
jgi:hypothetical protein